MYFALDTLVIAHVHADYAENKHPFQNCCCFHFLGFSVQGLVTTILTACKN